MPAKLLLADDSVTIQRVIELTFAEEDVQVFTVGDGRAAIEQIQRDRPDIVLADVGMPERDGYEVAAFVKGTPELAAIPVLLLTGAFEPVDEARARSVGCDGVLVKPFEPQMVISRVRDLLAGRRPEGLWAGAQAASPARQASSGDFDLRGAVNAPPAAPAGSLEDYFDRLDAAFASLEGAPAQPAPPVAPAAPAPVSPAPPGPDAPPQAGAFADDLVGWDPDISGGIPSSSPEPGPEPAPPAPMPAAAAPAASGSIAPAAGTRLEVPAGAPPTLGEAFAALLTAEQGQSFAPNAAKSAPPAVSPQAIDDAVRRALDGMTAQAVRETVLDVAERLVREEIERIKAAAHPPSA
jgi:CheY-like chemotaxis protein